MFRRTSSGPKHQHANPTLPTSPTASLLSPPRSPNALFSRLLPSGSRFAEGALSAFSSSETGSDTTSVGIPSADFVPPWMSTDIVPPARLQKIRRSPVPRRPSAAAPSHLTRVEDDSGSEVTTTSSWMTASMASLDAAPPPDPPTPSRGVSFCPTPHTPAESFNEDDRLFVRSNETPALVVLRSVSPGESRICGQLLQTSLAANRDALRDIIPRRNGFVHTAIEAYNNHRGLILRPDDVWLAIVTQFSFFVNGNAEALRGAFVGHDGKRELTVDAGGNRWTIDAASLVARMADLMATEIADPDLRAWLMPDFTTTTDVDRTTCAIVMMGAMKDYFTYRFNLRCGIPRVTLEGDRRDWESILARLERLKQYGIRTVAWYHLLRPVLARIVAAYDRPTDPDNLEFWNKIAHRESGSGPQWLSGWITAFCVFNERGEWQGNTLNEERIREHEPKKLLRPADPLQLTPSQFAAVYTVRERAPYLALDGFPYPVIESQDVPCGYACADVLLDDNGEVLETMLVAGSVGMQICSTERTELFRNGLRDTVRPVPAWWFFVKQERQDSDEEESDG